MILKDLKKKKMNQDVHESSIVIQWLLVKKGSLENNHKEIRYICPKENDLNDLGLNSQEKANLIVSHINSQSKEHLKGKSPLEVMEFMNPALYQKFKDFGIERINKDNIVLKPYLLKD